MYKKKPTRVPTGKGLKVEESLLKHFNIVYDFNRFPGQTDRHLPSLEREVGKRPVRGPRIKIREKTEMSWNWIYKESVIWFFPLIRFIRGKVAKRTVKKHENRLSTPSHIQHYITIFHLSQEMNVSQASYQYSLFSAIVTATHFPKISKGVLIKEMVNYFFNGKAYKIPGSQIKNFELKFFTVAGKSIYYLLGCIQG